MKFIFKAKDLQGQVREGVVEAPTAAVAAEILGRNTLVPIFVREDKKTLGIVKDFQKAWEGVSQKELVVFLQQLAILVEARVPLVFSLRTIEEQTDNKYFRLILKEIADDVEDGAQFSVAMEKHADVFSSLMVSMLRAGEASGELQKSIEVISTNIEKNYQLTAKIKSALYYPIFVLAVAFIIGFLVVTFVLPKLTIMIKELGVPVPWYTTALIWLGDFMSVWWWAVLIVLAGFGGIIMYYMRTASGKQEWERVVLNLPVIGQLAKSIYITRFAENLAALMDGGIPVVRALMITSQVVGNEVFEKIILKSADEVRSGGKMSEVLLHSDHFPPIVAQMIRIGEETGSLSTVLGSVAKFYNQEVETTTRSLTVLIEPVLIVFLGIGVAILVVGILLPIYDVASKL